MHRIRKSGWKVGVLALAIVLVPTAALAAVGTFSSTTTAPAVTGTNSSAATGAAGVLGTNTGNGLNPRYGVLGSANGAAGVGVQGTGTKYGLFSNGPLGVAAGKTLVCTGCVGANPLAANSVTAAKLAAGSVTAPKLGAASVATASLQDGSVTASKLAPGVVPITTVKSIVGPVPSTALTAVTFVGPTVSVTIGAGQKLVASVTANLVSTAGAKINSDICVDSGGGPTAPGANYLDLVNITSTGVIVTATETYALSPGTYNVGLCNASASTGTVDFGDWAQGYAMVITSS